MRSVFGNFEVGRQFLAQLAVIGKREMLGVFLDKEIKRIDDDHVRQQIHFDRHGLGFFREHDPCQDVAEGILLPVEKMILRGDPQRIGQDRGAAVNRRAQPEHLG